MSLDSTRSMVAFLALATLLVVIQLPAASTAELAGNVVGSMVASYAVVWVASEGSERLGTPDTDDPASRGGGSP
jgi:hypothetical protein